MHSLIRMLIVISFAGIAHAGSFAQVKLDYQPVYFDSAQQLVFEPDLRLHLSMLGAVEVKLAFPGPLPDSTAYYPFIRFGDTLGNNEFMISIKGDRKRFLFSNGIDTFGSVSPNKIGFSDGAFHHLVLRSTTAGMQWNFDCSPAGSHQQQVGFSNLNPLNYQLYLGNLDDAQFPVAIETVRIWDNELEIGDNLCKLKDIKGVPEGGPPGLFKGLLAFTVFTANSEDLFYTENELYMTSYAGVPDGDYYFYKDGRNHITDPDEKLYALSFSKSKDGIRYVIPQWNMPLNKRNIDDVYAEIYRAHIDRDLFTNWQKPALYKLESKTQMKSFLKGRSIETIPVAGRGNIRRICGTFSGQRITSLNLSTDNFSDIMLAERPNIDDALQPFCLEIPGYATFRGFVVRQNADGLKAVAMVYSYNDEDASDQTVLNRLYALGNWIGANDPPAQRLNTGPWDINGNYSSVPVYSIKEVIPDSVYLLFKDQDSLLSYVQLNKKSYSGFRGRSNSSPGSILDKFAQHAIQMQGSPALIFTENGITTNSGAGLPRNLIRPKTYTGPYPDKIAWGGTFAQDQRPPLSRANFVGYDIFKMDPRDLQKAVYSKNELFKYPDENSFDYTTTDNKIIIPFGLVYRNDNVGTEKVVAQTYSSQTESSASWSMSVGVNIGVPLICSFSENVDYSKEWEEMQANHHSLTTAKTIEGKYALVLDKSKARLSDGFTETVDQMVTDIRNGIDPDYAGFIESFGTHYAYAVTYGGMAYLDIVRKDTSLSKSIQTKVGVEAKADAVIDIFSLGGSGSYQETLKDKFGEDKSIETIRFKTIGGNISKGQGWSLARGEEVPILLDLRLVSELFSPTFFDDPIIWTTLRAGIRKEIDRRADSLSNLKYPPTFVTIYPDPGLPSNVYRAEMTYTLKNGKKVTQTQIRSGPAFKFIVPHGADDDLAFSFGWADSNILSLINFYQRIVNNGSNYCFSLSATPISGRTGSTQLRSYPCQ